MTKRSLAKSLYPNRNKGDDEKAPWAKEELTRRQAEHVVDVVFGSIAESLRRGEAVHLPFGTFEVVEQPRRPVRGWFLGRVRVTYQKRNTIKFTLGDVNE